MKNRDEPVRMISSLMHQEWLAVGRKYKDSKLAIFSTNEAFKNVTAGMEENFQKESLLWCLPFIQD